MSDLVESDEILAPAPLATYTLTLHGPDEDAPLPGVLPAALEEAEENLSDLLPDGYRVEIKEWNA